MSPEQPHFKNLRVAALESRNRAEMTRLIEVQRAYTQIASMLQSHSDMRKSAVDKLADVPA